MSKADSQETGQAPSIARGLAWGASRVLSARGISLVRTLILARLLVPRDFGLFSAAVVTITVLEAFSQIGLDAALIQSRTIDRRQYDVAWTLGLLRGSIIAGIGFLAAPWAAQAFGEPGATPIIAFYSLTALLNPLRSIGLVREQRGMNFGPTVLTAITESAVDLLVAALLAPTLGAWALVWGALGGRIFALAVSYRQAPHRPRLLFDRELSRPLLVFGRYILLATIAGVLADAWLQSHVSRLLGAEALGVFFMARKIAQLPNEAIGDPISSVVMSEQARFAVEGMASTPESARAATRALSLGWILLTPVTLLLATAASPSVELLLGDSWSAVIPLLPLLLFEGWFGLMTDVSIPIVRASGRTHAELAAQSARALILIGGGFLWVSNHGVFGASLAFVLAGIASGVVSAIYAQAILPLINRRLLAQLGTILLAAIPSSWLAQSSLGFATGRGYLAVGTGAAGSMMPLAILGTILLIGVLVYLLSVWLFDRVLTSGRLIAGVRDWLRGSTFRQS